MSEIYVAAPGIRFVALNGRDWWAAYSPVSRRSVLISNEAAAILEWLIDSPATLEELACRVATELSAPLEATRGTIEAWWHSLIDTGLVCTTQSLAAIPRTPNPDIPRN